MTPTLSYTRAAASRLQKRLFLIASTVLIIAAMVCVHTLSPEARPSSAEAAPPAAGYYVGLTGNLLTVFTADGQTTLAVTDIDARALPAADRAALAAGIPLPSDAALSRLLEDYGS